MKTTIRLAMLVPLLLSFLHGQSWAQDWKPTHNVEIVSTSGPGGLNDLVARTLQDIWRQDRSLGVSITVANRPGGGGIVAVNYLRQHPGDGHYLLNAAANLVTNKIIGQTPYTYSDLTPLAVLFTEYEAVIVKPDSPIKDAMDFVQRLKKDPESLRIGLAIALGNEVHIGLSIPLQKSGVDIKRLRIAVFNSSPEVIASLLGDHVDAIAMSPGSIAGQVLAGKVRVLAVTSPKRLEAPFADVPTWKEVGVDAEFSAFYTTLAPQGLDESAKRYWVDKLRAATAQPAWKQRLAQQHWNDAFMGPDQAKPFLDQQYGILRATLTELGLVKD